MSTMRSIDEGRVLVARLDNCGDVLLAGPAIRAVAAGLARRRRYGRRNGQHASPGGAGLVASPASAASVPSPAGEPAASGRSGVVLLCGPRGRAAAEVLPGVEQVIQFRAPWIEPDPMPVRASDSDHLVETVRRLGVSEALILASSHQSPLPLALLLRWAGVERIGAVSHEHAGSLLDVRIKGDPDTHEVERNLLVAEAMGYERPADDRLRVDLGRSPVSGRFAPGRYVVVHPGASVPARTLSPSRWRAVVDRLARAGWLVLVTGSRQERGLTAAVVGKHRGVVDLGGRTTFRALGRLLEGAAALVAGNTGPVHLAAAVGAPVVEVFAPTVPLERWRPWRVPHVVLGDQGIDCAGCRSRVCPLPAQTCLGGVDPDAVERAVAGLTAGRIPAGDGVREPHPNGSWGPRSVPEEGPVVSR